MCTVRQLLPECLCQLRPQESWKRCMLQSSIAGDHIFAVQFEEPVVHGEHILSGARRRIDPAVNLRDLFAADHAADIRSDRHQFEGRHQCSLLCRNKLLGNNCLKDHGELVCDLPLLAGRKDIDDPVHGFGASGRVQRGEDKMSGLGCRHGCLHGLIVAHLSEKNDIRALAQGGAQGGCIAFCIRADLSLTYDAFIMPVEKFQRVFQRDDMLFLIPVDMVDDAGKRGGLSASCRSGHQHQSF